MSYRLRVPSVLRMPHNSQTMATISNQQSAISNQQSALVFHSAYFLFCWKPSCALPPGPFEILFNSFKFHYQTQGALMKKESFVFVLSASLLTGSVLAGTMGSAGSLSNRTWVGTLSMGPVWENGGATQTFYLAPGIEKSYIASQSTNALFDGEVFLGLQKTFTQTLQGQLGLAVVATSNANLSGVILDDAEPSFNNYIYNYQLQHTHVAVKGKLLADRGYWLIPWVSVSLGVGFNSAYSFQNTPTLFEAVTLPNFASHTETTFTYTVGAGVQKALSTHWQVGMGYEFADWGKSKLGRAQAQTLNSGLGLNHLYTNGVLFNLTYLA